MTVAITATEQDTWPVRVALGVTGLTIGDDVVVYRSVAGARTPVRAGTVDNTTVVGLAIIDAELPFGVPVTYVANVNGTDVATVGPNTYTLVGGKVALTDAITGLAAEVVIDDWSDKQFDLGATVFRAGGRNIVVSRGWGQSTSTVTLYTSTSSSADQLELVLSSAVEGIVQIRQAGPYDDVDAYLAVLTAGKARMSHRGTDQGRLWTLSVAETDPWADELVAAQFTLQDLADFYGTSSTLTDINTDVPGTLLDLALKDLS